MDEYEKSPLTVWNETHGIYNRAGVVVLADDADGVEVLGASWEGEEQKALAEVVDALRAKTRVTGRIRAEFWNVWTIGGTFWDFLDEIDTEGVRHAERADAEDWQALADDYNERGGRWLWGEMSGRELSALWWGREQALDGQCYGKHTTA